MATELMQHGCCLLTGTKQGDRAAMPARSDRRINKRTVDALRVQSGDAVFWDRTLPGFGIRVYASGRKVYVVQARGPAGSRRVALGNHVELPCERARKEAATVIDRIKRGEEPQPPAPVPVTEPRVADLVERYFRVHVATHCSAKTAAGYRYVVDKHILPALGTMRVRDVGVAEVAALHHELRSMPLTANRAVKILSKMFRLAQGWNMVPAGRNPCRLVRRYKEEPRERFLSPDEWRRLGRALREAEADGSVWPQAIAALRARRHGVHLRHLKRGGAPRVRRPPPAAAYQPRAARHGADAEAPPTWYRRGRRSVGLPLVRAVGS